MALLGANNRCDSPSLSAQKMYGLAGDMQLCRWLITRRSLYHVVDSNRQHENFQG